MKSSRASSWRFSERQWILVRIVRHDQASHTVSWPPQLQCSAYPRLTSRFIRKKSIFRTLRQLSAIRFTFLLLCLNFYRNVDLRGMRLSFRDKSGANATQSRRMEEGNPLALRKSSIACYRAFQAFDCNYAEGIGTFILQV